MSNLSITRSNLDVCYYIELQKRLLDVFLYISCTQKNFETHSIKLASLILEAGTLFDSLSQTFIRSRCSEGLTFKAAGEIKHLEKKLNGSEFFKITEYRTLFETEFSFSKCILNLNVYHDEFYRHPYDCYEDSSYRHVITPFQLWGESTNPKWWSAYTKLKHDRAIHFELATLGNTIEVFGGLFMVLSFFHERFFAYFPDTELFRLFTPLYYKPVTGRAERRRGLYRLDMNDAAK